MQKVPHFARLQQPTFTHTFDLAGQYLKWTCFGLCAKAQDIPPDALALLDMNGIDVTRWKRLQHLQYGYDA